MSVSDFSVLEQKVKKALETIQKLKEENTGLREKKSVPDGISEEAQTKIAALEKKIMDLEEKNKRLLLNKEKIKEKIEDMQKKFEILNL